MIEDIDRNIEIINDSLAWAREFGKESFPTEQFKEYRRRLRCIRSALAGNCSIAAYGESQVGKSYLMSSLLSAADSPFVIENNNREYSFINEINPSGGANANIESTGVITRFTVRKTDNAPRGMVKITNLTVIDLILLIVDSYYKDVKIDPGTSLSSEVINRQLESMSGLWSGQRQHDVISEDDIKDINDYIREVVGNSAQAVFQSKFCSIVAPVIQNVPYTDWVDIFSLLWNKNPELDRLFVTLINAYKKLDFNEVVYVPFDTVLNSKGTLLKIQWLDTVCGVAVDMGGDVLTTDVFGSDGRLVAANFSKGDLSALTAELTFELPDTLTAERTFLRRMDLLDFPGARSREQYRERDVSNVLPKMLRRGKVAYLFNKYSRSLQISSVLFCHHNDQKAEPTLGDTINNWIEVNIGRTAAERSTLLRATNGISPLFFIATKFNKDLQRGRNDNPKDVQSLDNHWKRFDTVFPEIIKPNTWVDQWTVSAQGQTVPFRGFYPLRDFYWSAKCELFTGYCDGEIKSPELAQHIDADYPDYFDRLRESFTRNAFVRNHFANPDEAWDTFAGLNNDGSKVIIRDLGAISGTIVEARRTKYFNELVELKNKISDTLKIYYVPEDSEAKNKRVRLIAGDIRRSLVSTVAKNPAAFGCVIDRLMISPEALRNIAYDIVVRHIDAPRDFSQVNLIRFTAGINLDEPRSINIGRMLDEYMVDTEAELHDRLREQGLELDDIITNAAGAMSTMGDIVTKHIVNHWIEHLNAAAGILTEILPHADEVVHTLVSLFKKLDVRSLMVDKINSYIRLFSVAEQPNAIGDYASLTLNNFVGNVGSEYFDRAELATTTEKARTCRIPLDENATDAIEPRRPQSLVDTLRVFDEAADIINSNSIDMTALTKLPFWRNYRRWQTLLFIGLVYSSDIAHCDPVCNARVRELMDRISLLYKS